jgi:hypothetical protein
VKLHFRAARHGPARSAVKDERRICGNCCVNAVLGSGCSLSNSEHTFWAERIAVEETLTYTFHFGQLLRQSVERRPQTVSFLCVSTFGRFFHFQNFQPELA